MCMLQEGCSYCYIPCVASVVTRCVRAVVALLAVDSLAVSPSLLVLAEVRFPQNYVVLVSGYYCIALLVEVHRLVALCSGEVSQNRLFSQNCALVVLVEVLPGLAYVVSAVLLAAVFSLKVCVVWSFGLCVLVKVLPRIALCCFWRRFFPGVLCVRFGPPLCCLCGLKCVIWLGCVLVRFSQDGSWRFWWRVELSLLPVGLSVLQSAWAFPVKVLCAWLMRWPACLVSHFQVSRLSWWDFVCPHGLGGLLLSQHALTDGGQVELVVPLVLSFPCGIVANVVVALLKLSAFRVFLLWVSGGESPTVGPVSSRAVGAVVCAAP
ncbi:hypothetical protein Taro_037766 [Colocasia esculenta]|uniref:Uncharacterized protein n=1 Tax=Colocasia esculenta TaxID=4460 RepID=A0A843W501_COLES|nr:hypothetical protein [Colocasia esculenta]